MCTIQCWRHLNAESLRGEKNPTNISARVTVCCLCLNARIRDANLKVTPLKPASQTRQASQACPPKCVRTHPIRPSDAIRSTFGLVARLPWRFVIGFVRIHPHTYTSPPPLAWPDPKITHIHLHKEHPARPESSRFSQTFGYRKLAIGNTLKRCDDCGAHKFYPHTRRASTNEQTHRQIERCCGIGDFQRPAYETDRRRLSAITINNRQPQFAGTFPYVRFQVRVISVIVDHAFFAYANITHCRKPRCSLQYSADLSALSNPVPTAVPIDAGTFRRCLFDIVLTAFAAARRFFPRCVCPFAWSV